VVFYWGFIRVPASTKGADLFGAFLPLYPDIEGAGRSPPDRLAWTGNESLNTLKTHSFDQDITVART